MSAKPVVKDTLYDELVEQATNSRLKESLARVRKACDFLESTKATIGPTTVGKYCEQMWGGPMPQSIRNAKTTLFRYVETRQGMQSLPRATKSSEPGEPAISDATVRAYVSLLRAERDEAVRLKNRIIAGLRKIPGIPIETLIANGFTPPTVEPNAASSTLSPTAANAISKLLDPEKVAKVGLELHRSRLRNNITGELLLDKSEVEALQALLASQSEGDAPALPPP